MLISDFFSKPGCAVFHIGVPVKYVNFRFFLLQNANNCVMSPNRALATETLLVGET